MTYDTLNDGTLACRLSTTIDDAGSSMVQLIQEHMVVILRPINEHIEHLYVKHGELERAVTERDAVVEQDMQRLKGFEVELAAQDAKYLSLVNEVKMFQSDVKDLELKRRLASFEAETRASKKARMELDERLDRIQSEIEAVQPKLDDSHAAIHRVEVKAWQAVSGFERFDRDIDQLRKDLGSWHERQLGLARGVEEIHNAHENTRRCIVKLSGDVESSSKKARKDVAALEERTKGLEVSTAETARMLPPLQDKLEYCRQQLGAMHEHFEHIDSDMKRLEEENKAEADAQSKIEAEIAAKIAEDQKKQMTVLDKFKELETMVVKMRQAFAQEMQKNLSGAVRDIGLTVERNSGTIIQHSQLLRHLEVTQTGHTDQLRNFETRAGESEAVQADLVKRAHEAHAHISDLLSAYKDTESRLETHKCELDKMEAYTSTTRHALGQTNAVVQHLHGDLGTTKGGLANTAMRIDLAHEYINGVSRGLQETHKLSLAGQDGMLSTKGGLDRTRPLPMIGVHGRPPSVQRGKTSQHARPPGGSEAPAGVEAGLD